MNIRVEKFDFSNEQQRNALVKWDCDRELFHLVFPVQEEQKAFSYPNAEEVAKKYQDPDFVAGVYVVMDGDKPIGNLSIQIDPPHVLKAVKGTSWLGLIIGEREYWGTRAATDAMKFFEEESKKMGLKRVELGTFEFNVRAHKFYLKQGYREIGRIKNFTYYDGRFWDDIRMEKTL